MVLFIYKEEKEKQMDDEAHEKISSACQVSDNAL